MNVTNVDSL